MATSCFYQNAIGVEKVIGSGFYNLWNPNDEVMVDRGFTIDEELLSLHVRLNIPAF